jgi:hypothetical protein
MKTLLCCTALVITLMINPGWDVTTSRSRLAVVTVNFTDSFGSAAPGCKILGFKSFNEGDQREYVGHFGDSMVGKDIPFGRSYRVLLTCGGRNLGPFWVSVSRSDQFLALSAWMHGGDYETGALPRLTVTVSPDSFKSVNGTMWIKVVALYARDQEVDLVDPSSRSARFYEIEPGSLLVLALTENRTLCVQPLKIQGPHANVTLTWSGPDCKASDLSEAEVDLP